MINTHRYTLHIWVCGVRDGITYICNFVGWYFIYFQAVHDVMLETIFPICGFMDVPIYPTTMSQLSSGETHREMWSGGILAAGSSAEGLAMKPVWGHPMADEDIMAMFGGPLGVCMPQGRHQGQQSIPPLPSTQDMQTESCLEFAPEGCPPAYTRLRVTDTKALMAHPWVTADCVEEFADGEHWLLTTFLNETIQWNWNNDKDDDNDDDGDDDDDDDDDDEKSRTQTTGISGPAGQVNSKRHQGLAYVVDEFRISTY